MAEADDALARRSAGPFPAAETFLRPAGQPAFCGWQRWAVLAAFALIVILRLPNAWTHGRFLDEEATVFLAYAWHFPWVEALFRPFAGYWNAAANASTVLAVQLIRGDLLTLERAPYFTMGVGLTFQLMPAALILTGKASWLASRPAVIAALLLIAIAPATEEVFYNVLHIQLHLALCAALILAFAVPEKKSVRFGYGGLLFLAPLSGLGAIVLLPLFLLRALADREPGRFFQAASLAAGSAVQLFIFLGSSTVRGQLLDIPSLAAAMFVRMILLPMFGPDYATIVGFGLADFDGFRSSLIWAFAAALVLLFGALLLFAMQRRDGAVWLLLSSFSITAMSLGGGMVGAYNSAFHVYAGERYNFLPVVLLGLTIVVIAAREQGRGKYVWRAICSWLILIGALNYPRPHSVFFANGPSWPTEVQKWRSDRRHPLAVWPRPWTADLSNESKPCSPPSQPVRKSNEPRYCESGWMKSFSK
ncbi:hypothetical protein LZ496_11885 [Sphingomonas sp. NSE70-1]|uniref:Uncharacterized protein n=1 Tax=Sphingomonas caseinilyticus TaxID=2908205 RepID=A0ABT0RXM9_9SPHN|nr:hypothetical protein [Sphingomonas caseinilyticus]MCL6699480.1 hypothetical protein [Sphingomonas caseinilyticus]